MNISSLIINTLKPLKIPVKLLKYTGKETTYIVFQEYLQQGEGFSEDDVEITGHYILLNLFSKTDYTDLVVQTKSLLEDAGFKRTAEYELYENDTGYYNKILKYYFEEVN